MRLDLLKSILSGKLRSKFILIFVVLASVPVLVLGGVSIYLISISHKQDVSNLELQLIDQKIEEVEKFFLDTLGALRLDISITQATDIEFSSITWQQILAESMFKSNPAFEELSIIDFQGKERGKKSRNNKEVELLNVSRFPKFEEGKKGKNYISEVHYTLDGPTVTMAAPLKYQDRIIQVISAEVDLSQITKSVESSRLGASGYILLVDQNGRFLSHRGKANLYPGADLSQWERIKRILTGEVLDGFSDKDRYESMFGTPVIGAGKKITDVGWGILVEWPIQDADSIIRDVKNQVINLTIFSIFAVMILALFFANRLVKPIRDLEAGAVEIEKGNFEKRVEVKTRDELEELGEAFNRMAVGLKRLHELKNEFVFIAAHELRTPVTAIKGYLSMVFEGSAGDISEKLKKYLDPVWQANERLVELVNNILEIARSEAGRMKIEVSSCDIGESVNSILTEIKPLADNKKITVSYDAPANLPKVISNMARLKEVITNFVSNAIKYNNEGGWVKIYHEIMPDMVITHVEDNGFGLSEEDQKHLFEKFFRSEAGRVKAIQGTGLGLFITKELVEKMGGKLWFKSAEGKGTKFSFSLNSAIS